MIWQVLDVRAIWIKEFAAALSRQVPVIGWLPQFGAAALFQNREKEFSCDDPPLRIRSFPLQRGFARFPFSTLANEGNRIARRLTARCDAPSASPLICTAPQYTAVAERWPGPVVYYATDLFAAYRKQADLVHELEQRMCKAATIVCPNSQRIAEHLRNEAHCPDEKISVIPNATRRESLFDSPPNQTGDLPSEISDLSRPVAGVVGNLGENTDWLLLTEVVEKTPWLSWVCVGPTNLPIADKTQDAARRALVQRGGRVHFVPAKPYSDLKPYARSFDVAVLPYRKIEPTYSGSSTRFYEHLAAGRPMIATRGVQELLHKEPLLRLVDSVPEAIAALDELRATKFRDGYESARWQASVTETWEARAADMVAALRKKAALSQGVAA